MLKKTALVVVDMQKYYLNKESDFYKFSVSKIPGVMDYIVNRCEKMVLFNISKLLLFFRSKKLKVIYLRLCSSDPKRKDLHRFFKHSFDRGMNAGFNNIYPLKTDPMADIVDELKPNKGEKIINKTSFSPFTSTNINEYLEKNDIQCLVFTGLATSQCVETTARDASDNGYSIVHIEDAQADYRDQEHIYSLFSSTSVCGGWVTDTVSFLENHETFLAKIKEEER